MQRSAADLPKNSSRILNLRHFFLKRINPKRFNTEATVLDWVRERGYYVYFNGKRAFKDGTFIQKNENSALIKANLQNVKNVITANLPNTDKHVVEYIEKYSHQFGYIGLAEKETKNFLSAKNILVDRFRYRYDFIENNDSSVTHVERVYIDRYMESGKSGFVKTKNGGPIAVVITTSTIRLTNGQVKHELTSEPEKILLADKLGEELFDDNDGDVEKKYDKTPAEIEKELDDEINSQVLKNQEQRQHPEPGSIEVEVRPQLEAPVIPPPEVQDVPVHQPQERPFEEDEIQVAREENVSPQVEAPPMEKKQKPGFFKRHWVAITTTTLSFAVTGGTGGAFIAVSTGLLTAAPTGGLSLLATAVGAPILALIGFLGGAAVGFCAGVIGSLASDYRAKAKPKYRYERLATEPSQAEKQFQKQSPTLSDVIIKNRLDQDQNQEEEKENLIADIENRLTDYPWEQKVLLKKLSQSEDPRVIQVVRNRINVFLSGQFGQFAPPRVQPKTGIKPSEKKTQKP